MKNKIYYSKKARRDLDEIWDYIVSELQNRLAAEKTVNRIMDAVDQLVDFTEIGTPLSAVADIESDYRVLTAGNYLIFYRTPGKEIYVDRILYGRRDYLRILFGDTADEN